MMIQEFADQLKLRFELQKLEPSFSISRGWKKPGKWKDVWNYEGTIYDWRTVLGHEIVFDLDKEHWNDIRLYGNLLNKTLDTYTIPTLAGPSGGKGWHWHLFYDPGIMDKLFGMRPTREWIFWFILYLAKIRRKENPFDMRKVAHHKDSSLIREFGSKNKNYKTARATVSKTRDGAYRNLRIPTRIKVWKVPVSWQLKARVRPLNRCLTCKIKLTGEIVPVNDSTALSIECAICKGGE